MEVLEFCTEVQQPKVGLLDKLRGIEPGPRVFEVDPAVMYPAMVAHVGVKFKQDPPNEGLRRYYAMAKRIQGKSSTAFGSALLPRELCITDLQTKYRAEALETCRLWFTKMLHQAIGGGPMVVHILRDERYRL